MFVRDDLTLSKGQYMDFCFDVPKGSLYDFRATMGWCDAPADPRSDVALVNNLVRMYVCMYVCVITMGWCHAPADPRSEAALVNNLACMCVCV